MPINNLPSEILQAVFELVVGKASRQPPSVDDGLTTQEILCGVCPVWRELALHDPLLWDTIYFPTTEGALQRTKLFLQRSATAPLNIHITRRKNEELSVVAIYAYGLDFLKLINAESHRWRALDIDIPELVMDLKPIWDGHVPMLEELAIFSWVPHQSNTRSQWPCLPDGIKTLSIVRFALRWDQWDCLSVTHLSLGPFGTSGYAPTPTELCGILTALSDTLCSLAIKGTWQGSRDGTTFNGPVILKALKSLTTSTGWEPHTRDILEGCRFPALEHIDTHISLLDTLPPTLISVLSDEPKLFLSVKRLSIGLVGDPNSSTGQVLQRAFPQLDYVQLSPYTPLDASLSTFLSRSWGSTTRLDLSEAELFEVRELLSKRLQNHPTPLRELRLLTARGILYRVDYDWIKSHVGHFVISQMRPNFPALIVNRNVRAFDERHLVAQAPTQRAPRNQIQTRAL
jgi:F-box-like